ncbi:CPBP family glutamic-type intramembrane protease [Microbacterium hydrocarbonoxydans]|jgi:membrane protease YdiL (CAAX protease family)|uniref:CPBP family glutamic-type intramembrane protease n=1 Tax=Microbacterium hydrocarbonoxydans TaxID=273678 RepID=UPI003D99B76F
MNDVTRQRGLRGVIARHPLVSFFVLANALSWSAWTPYILSNNGLGGWDYTFELGQLTGMLPGAYLGPITSALIVTAITGGAAGLRQWGARLWRWRVRWHWYAIAVLGVPAALIVTGLMVSGGQVMAPSVTVLAVYLPMLVLQMLTTGLAEEPGWRDFALPRLQDKFGPMRSAFILGPLWALWHMPLFLTEWGGYPEADWTRPASFAVFCIAFNVVMAWVFNRTGQSLPLAMLAHVSVNNFMSVVWSEMFPTVSENVTSYALAVSAVIAAVIVIIATRGKLGYRKEQSGQVDEAVLVRPDDRLKTGANT